ncbi:MAG: hypothetical protein K6B38_09205 [Ruminococcus sp.]|nr:hypothetical protein [Ruminococcus sp.]
MKNNSFAGLLYREYYLCKKSLFFYFLIFLCFSVIGWLILLSMKYGNLALLFNDEASGRTGIIQDKFAADFLRLLINISAMYLPLCGAFFSSFAPFDIAVKDTLASWIRFEHCTPLTPLKFASVKLVSTMIGTLISFAISVLHLFSVRTVMGEKFTFVDISIIIFLLTFITAFCVLSQIYLTLFRNSSIGIAATTVTMMCPLIIIAIINSVNSSDEITKPENIGSELTKYAERFFPLMLIVLLSMFILLFVSMYLLYKRREK